MKEQKKGLATRDDKIRGCTSMVLMFAGFIFAHQQVDQSLIAGGLCFGVLNMCTLFAIMFKDMDTVEG